MNRVTSRLVLGLMDAAQLSAFGRHQGAVRLLVNAKAVIDTANKVNGSEYVIQKRDHEPHRAFLSYAVSNRAVVFVNECR